MPQRKKSRLSYRRKYSVPSGTRRYKSLKSKIESGPSDNTDHSYFLGSLNCIEGIKTDEDCIEGIKTDENDSGKFDTIHAIGQDTTENNSQYGNVDMRSQDIACGSENTTSNMEVVHGDSDGRNMYWSSQHQIKSDITDSGKCGTADPICDYYVMLLLNQEREHAIRKMYLERNWDYDIKVLSSEELSMINLLRSEEGTEVLHAIRKLEQEPAGSVVEPKTEINEASIEPVEIKVEVNNWNEDHVQSRIDPERNTARLCLNEEIGKDVLEISEIFSEDKNVSFIEKEDIKDASGTELKCHTEYDLKVVQNIDLESVSENECLSNLVHENVVNQTKQHTYNTEIAVVSDIETENYQVIEAECGNEDFDDNKVMNYIDMEIGNPDDSDFMPYITGQNVNVKSNADVDESGIKTGSHQTNVQFELEENKVDTSFQISYGEANLDIIQNRLESVSEHQLVQKSKQIKFKAAMRKHVKPDLYHILKPMLKSPKQPPVRYLTNIKSISQHNSGKVGEVTSISAGKIERLKTGGSVKRTKKNRPKTKQKFIDKKTEKNPVKSPRPSASSVDKKTEKNLLKSPRPSACSVDKKTEKNPVKSPRPSASSVDKKTEKNPVKSPRPSASSVDKKTEKNPVKSSRPSAGSVHICSVCGKAFRFVTHLRYHSRKTGHKNSQLEYRECEKCGKFFKSVAGAWKHNLLHHQEDEQAKCELCSASFKSDFSLRHHLKLCHTIDPIKCLICSKTFRNKYILKRHMLRTHDAKRFWCRVCERSLVGEIKVHMRTQIHLKKSLGMPTVVDGKVIKLMNETVNSEGNSLVTNKDTNLVNYENRDIDGFHIKSEMVAQEASFSTDEISNDCLHIISESLSTETSLPPGSFEKDGLPTRETNANLVDDLESSHMITTDTGAETEKAAKLVNHSTANQKTCSPVTNVPYSVTSMSKQKISSGGNTSKRLKNATDNKCFICHSDFSDVVLLTKHMQKDHPGTVETYMSYKCEICNHHVYDLTKHKKEWHHEKEDSKINRPIYQCDTCGRCLSSKICLDVHIATKHESTGEKYNCDKCKKAFRHPVTLRRHKAQYHSVNKPVTCDICNNVYANDDLLRRHKICHNQKYWCNMCNKPFPHSNALRAHQQTNAHLKLLEKVEKGEDVPATKKFICDLCGTEFSSKVGLSLHKTKLHKVKK